MLGFHLLRWCLYREHPTVRKIQHGIPTRTPPLRLQPPISQNTSDTRCQIASHSLRPQRRHLHKAHLTLQVHGSASWRHTRLGGHWSINIQQTAPHLFYSAGSALRLGGGVLSFASNFRTTLLPRVSFRRNQGEGFACLPFIQVLQVRSFITEAHKLLKLIFSVVLSAMSPSARDHRPIIL